jgi:hypothetical protein
LALVSIDGIFSVAMFYISFVNLRHSLSCQVIDSYV